MTRSCALAAACVSASAIVAAILAVSCEAMGNVPYSLKFPPRVSVSTAAGPRALNQYSASWSYPSGTPGECAVLNGDGVFVPERSVVVPRKASRVRIRFEGRVAPNALARVWGRVRHGGPAGRSSMVRLHLSRRGSGWLVKVPVPPGRRRFVDIRASWPALAGCEPREASYSLRSHAAGLGVVGPAG